MEHTNEMIIDFNVLRTSMQNGMSSKMGGTKIITKEDWKNGMCSLVRNVSIQISSKAALARPLYSDSTLERETTFCLVQD